jgi:hypothetical protein
VMFLLGMWVEAVGIALLTTRGLSVPTTAAAATPDSYAAPTSEPVKSSSSSSLPKGGDECPVCVSERNDESDELP